MDDHRDGVKSNGVRNKDRAQETLKDKEKVRKLSGTLRTAGPTPTTPFKTLIDDKERSGRSRVFRSKPPEKPGQIG